MGMNSIGKLLKMIIANHYHKKENEEEQHETKKLLVIFLTDVRATQNELEESDQFYDTLLNLFSNAYVSFIDFSQDMLTKEYLNILSSEFPNVTNDDLSLIRNAVDEAKQTGPTEEFQLNYADYLENFLFKSIKHNI